MIPKEVVEEIRYRCDIEDVISTYVSLKRAGSNRSGLCPFHSEKTPSFTVFPGTKSFYCFGCGAGGDVVTFIQKIENLDYVDALEFLAKRAGVQIPQDTRGEEYRQSVSRKRVYEMNLEAAKFFRACLFDPNIGADGMRYLTEDRKFSSITIKRFGFGYAPNDFGMLTRHMKKLGYSDEELIVAFLCGRSQRTGKLFDLYRERVVIPVIDVAGNVVAFTARALHPDEKNRKYFNTSDTPAFKKSRILFGMNYAKNHCAEQMILCEGAMDAIALQAAGFENAVATLGTAITQEHARLLSRYTKRVLINYDSDAAGQAATNKAMALLDQVGLEVRVLKLTGAKDADEYLKQYGADAFRSIIAQGSTGFDFKMGNVLAQNDISQPEGKIRAARALAAIIAAVASGVERELYVQSAAKQLGISPEGLANDVKRLRARAAREYRQKERRELQLGARNFSDHVNPDAAKSPAVAAAEETALGLLMLYPEHRRAVCEGKVELPEAHFFTSLGKRVFAAICEMEKSESGFVFSALGEHFTPDEMGRLVRLQQDRQKLSNNGIEVLEDAARVLADEYQKRSEREAGDLQSEIERRRAALKKKDK
ncbi:MAG: DNA primase [Ruminococcaceae bacterium]|nr:DNA primase [Oscillospiraceae bacterium]